MTQSEYEYYGVQTSSGNAMPSEISTDGEGCDPQIAEHLCEGSRHLELPSGARNHDSTDSDGHGSIDAASDRDTQDTNS